MTNAQSQFTMDICIDRDAYGDAVVYVDDKSRTGRTYTFGDPAAACDALADWKQIAQVVVPREGFWRHVSGFQTELKTRRDRKSEQEKLAQRLARIRAGLELGVRQRYQFEGEDLERFQLQYEDTRRMTTTALKTALQQEDMTLVGARAKAKAKAERKATIRAEYRTAKATQTAQVISSAADEAAMEAVREHVISAMAQNGKVAPSRAAKPAAVPA